MYGRVPKVGNRPFTPPTPNLCVIITCADTMSLRTSGSPGCRIGNIRQCLSFIPQTLPVHLSELVDRPGREPGRAFGSLSGAAILFGSGGSQFSDPYASELL